MVPQLFPEIGDNGIGIWGTWMDYHVSRIELCSPSCYFLPFEVAVRYVIWAGLYINSSSLSLLNAGATGMPTARPP